MADGTGITVLHGKPDAAELAAVTAVLLARLRALSADVPATAAAPRAEWTVRGDGRPAATSWTARSPRGRR
ncbi:acyl-CoA carboxylase subunit epsilon [Streptomyces ferrugineus]|uniref:Acyl-CoA carboxylase subunit epsilon n=1 Tax=Streptomyces ferrugineus TaxID=1413221 RepID=A0A7M2SI53_9ACTN|nr:acyl-CoA carboxylase epsilon subunit [Streptomyces ferrugineus]QOV35709.1 acyl-CoA carboxylase subunit epsilon [Streptomyces ferrugineus]